MSLLKMLVKRQSVVFLPATSTIYQACQTMTANNIGSIVVMEGGELKGIFTERDLLNRVVAAGLDYSKVTLDLVMTKNVVAVSVEESLQDCFHKMEKTRCRRLPIVEGERVVGMVTMRDILEWINKQMEEENIQMKKYIQS